MGNYRLKGLLIEQSDQRLADEIEVSRSRLSRIKNQREPVSPATADQIVEGASRIAQSSNQAGYTLEDFRPLLWLAEKWQVMPELARDDQLELGRAIALDMADAKGSAAAVVIAAALVAKLPQPVEIDSLEFQTHAFLWDRYLTFLDHAGQPQTALDLLEQKFSKHWKTNTWTRIPALNWLRYQEGICLARCGQIEAARECFIQLRQLNPLDRQVSCGFPEVGVAAAFQELQLLVTETTAATPVTVVEQIATDLRQLLPHWEETHRSGYVHRCLGTLFSRQGRKADALRAYLEAHRIFSEHQCRRYVDATQALIEQLVFGGTDDGTEK